MVLGGNNGKGNSKNWIHAAETLINGKVNYVVKFIGKAEVSQPRGMDMVKTALQKLNFSRQIKRTEGSKPPKVELSINVHSVSISDSKTKEVLHRIRLHRVSFCADDKQDKRLFAFIAKLEDDKHYCYGLDSLHQANEITLTIGQAFELAYELFVKDNPSAGAPKKVSEMSKRIHELEKENADLRRRILMLESETRLSSNPAFPTTPTQDSPKVNSSPSNMRSDTSNIAIPRRSSTKFTSSNYSQEKEMIDAFNMQPFSPPAARLPQPPSKRSSLSKADLLIEENTIDPFRHEKGLNWKMQEMQGIQSQDISPNRKSNYHIISHPLIQKKKSRNSNSALKWSKKYFPNGKQAPARSLGRKNASSKSKLSAKDGFSKGLTISEENLTLDSFDPLKQ